MKAPGQKLILSIYDLSLEWCKPYIQAGYPVIAWDKQREGDILERFGYLISLVEESGLQVHGILAAVPCTDFAGSGARWWKDKDQPKPGYDPFENSTELSVALALIVLEMVELFKPQWWVIENPVGRLERMVPELKSQRLMSFDPCEFGDPYTKRTILWGKFNTELQRNPVEPTQGSLMHRIPPGKNRASIRSKTPAGFAKSFFNANP